MELTKADYANVYARLDSVFLLLSESVRQHPAVYDDDNLLWEVESLLKKVDELLDHFDKLF